MWQRAPDIQALGDKEKTANSRLYQVAKIVVTNVQRKEVTL